jgi:predicted amidohydrolase YtcJ
MSKAADLIITKAKVFTGNINNTNAEAIGETELG